MRLPKPLLRIDSQLHKNNFGHILVLAGSSTMLGACALTALAAMRMGAGLVTCGIPNSLNLTLQRKISNVIMTLPLAETKNGKYSSKAYTQIEQIFNTFDSVAIGPGMGRDVATQDFIRRIIAHCPKPMVIDADALNALSMDLTVLQENKNIKVLTPHPGEMTRLLNCSRDHVETHRKEVALNFANKHNVVLVLKGHKTIVADPLQHIFINTTGNVGMATAGSGDVLTGMITGLLAQGISPFDAAKYGVYLHGKAGDLAAKHKTKASMLAVDMIEEIPAALKQKAS